MSLRPRLLAIAGAAAALAFSLGLVEVHYRTSMVRRTMDLADLLAESHPGSEPPRLLYRRFGRETDEPAASLIEDFVAGWRRRAGKQSALDIADPDEKPVRGCSAYATVQVHLRHASGECWHVFIWSPRRRRWLAHAVWAPTESDPNATICRCPSPSLDEIVE